MTESQNYRRPPVSEGLIDFRIDPMPADRLGLLNNLHEKEVGNYPTMRLQKRWAGHLELSEGAVTAAQQPLGVSGYIFESKDKSRVIQYRLDGFTCNFLKPLGSDGWPGWEHLRNEARRAWDNYVKTLSVQEVTRIAVRYINKIFIPGPLIELREYFTNAPDAPKDFEYQNVSNFLSKVTMVIPELGAYATITHAPAKEPTSDAVVILLDIEIARNQRFAVPSDSVWETLNRFRNIKNSIFEKSLTPKAKELFQ